MYKLFILTFTLLTQFTYGQTNAEEAGSKAKPQEEEVFTVVEVSPEFPGGSEKMIKFIKKNINNCNTHGKVVMGFEVDKDGNLDKIKVLKGIEKACDDEAMRIVKLMPKWTPGKMKNKNVTVKVTIPVTFQK